MMPSNPITVFKQVFTKMCILTFVMPLMWHENEEYVLLVALCWSLGELVRYPYYQFKSLQTYLGHLRYNFFIPIYPVGIFAE